MLQIMGTRWNFAPNFADSGHVEIVSHNVADVLKTILLRQHCVVQALKLCYPRNGNLHPSHFRGAPSFLQAANRYDLTNMFSFHFG